MKSSKSGRNIKNYTERRRAFTDKAIGILFSLWMITCAFYLGHAEYSTIGSDIRYNLIILFLPLAIGTSIIVFHHKNIIHTHKISALKQTWKKITTYIILLFCAVLFSFITLGIIAMMAFEVINHMAASNTKPEVVVLPVTKFYEDHGKRPTHKIYFIFREEKEAVPLSREDIRYYQSLASTHKHIRLIIREGIWNYYIVDDWKVIP